MKLQRHAIVALAGMVLLLSACGVASAQYVGQSQAPAPASAPTSLASLGSMQASLRDLAAKVRPAVVEINVTEVIKQEVPSFTSPFDWF
ncbi:MAG TPA: hypothetical protein VMQ10_03955, partial [Spirochaetia bacterium]|nr:hypothetical protein [Spirochaetia bacterium]